MNPSEKYLGRFGPSLDQNSGLCPYCGVHNNRASGVASQSERPFPPRRNADGRGEYCVAICVACKRTAVYGDDMKLRKPTASEKEELDEADDIRAAIAALEDATKRRDGIDARKLMR